MTIRAATRLCGIDKSTRSLIVSALLRFPCLPRHSYNCIGRNSRFGIDTQTARYSHYTDELLILREAKRLGTPFAPSALFSRRKAIAPGIDLQSNASIPVLLSVTGICVVLLFAFTPFSGGKVKNNDESLGIDDFQHFDQMDAAAVSGHLGNLTPDQEGKLLELWQAIFKISGTQARNDNATPTASATQSAKPDTEVETPRKRRGFGFFRSAPQQTPSSPNSHNTDVSSEEDKFGLAKQFQAIVATENPRDIREALWSMMKHDHPDSLVLRFLRARKWDVEKALVMLVSAMNWRHSKMKVDQEIMRTGEAGAAAAEKSENETEKQRGHDFLKQSRMGKSFLHGVDREGRPICVVRVRLHKSGEQSPESLEKYTVFIIETARLTLKPPVDTAVSVRRPMLSTCS